MYRGCQRLAEQTTIEYGSLDVYAPVGSANWLDGDALGRSRCHANPRLTAGANDPADLSRGRRGERLAHVSDLRGDPIRPQPRCEAGFHESRLIAAQRRTSPGGLTHTAEDTYPRTALAIDAGYMLLRGAPLTAQHRGHYSRVPALRHGRADARTAA